MKNTAYILLHLFLFGGCTHYPSKNQGIETIDFNRVSTEPFSQVEKTGILTNPVYTPLYFSEEMYLSDIDIIKTYKGKFFIAEKRSRKLMVFDANGMPLSLVGMRGRGPGEYLNISDFDIDDQGNIYLIDGTTDYLLIYNADYKFIESIKLPFEVELIKCLNNGNFLLALCSWNSGAFEDDMLVVVDREFNVVESVAKYDKSLIDNNLRLSNDRFVESFGKIFFHQGNIDDHVYVMDQSGHLSQTVHFDFGSQKVPYEFRNDVEPYYESKTIHNYRLLRDFVIVNDRYALGTLWDKGITKCFLLTRGDRKMYEKPYIPLDNASEYFINILDNKLVTLISTANDPVDNHAEKATWSDYRLCFYTLQ